VRALGHGFVLFLISLGQLLGLLKETLQGLAPGKLRGRLICRQIVQIGFGSQIVVVVTGAFVGAVFTAQMYYQFVQMGVESVVGAIVSIALCRELAPAMVGLMISGRVGASIAAEIGTMKVTEQIDALRGMAVNPVNYLVVPRFVGMLISMPLLIAETIVFGILASYIVAVWLFLIPEAWFTNHLYNWTDLEDVAFGMIKGLIFGLVIVIVSCHQGLTAENGAVGVGKATTKAVVVASLIILVANFFLTMILTFLFPFD
jgi:phospholipid/cholesterol/gamma-HCH transport system permease protein